MYMKRKLLIIKMNNALLSKGILSIVFYGAPLRVPFFYFLWLLLLIKNSITKVIQANARTSSISQNILYSKFF